ncbi:hypothetical protein BDF19DRAFT_281130 [Syncephalis fuscata]|nr:hypothetical protein BDF19DRAFT_281130 [Syncephalis fuscata]
MDLGRLLNPQAFAVSAPALSKDTASYSLSFSSSASTTTTATTTTMNTHKYAQTAKSAQCLRRLRARLGLASYRVACKKEGALAALERALQLELADRTRLPSPNRAAPRPHRASPPMANSVAVKPANVSSGICSITPTTSPLNAPLSSSAFTALESNNALANRDGHLPSLPAGVLATSKQSASPPHGPTMDPAIHIKGALTGDAETGAELLLFVKYAHPQQQSLDEALNVSNIHTRISNYVTTHVLSSDTAVSSHKVNITQAVTSTTTVAAAATTHHSRSPSRRYTTAKRAALHPYRPIAPSPAPNHSSIDPLKTLSSRAVVNSASASPPLAAITIGTRPASTLQSPWPTPESSPNFSALSCSASNLREVQSDMPKFTQLPQSLLPAGHYLA